MSQNKPTTFTSTTVRFWVWHEGSYTRLTLHADKPVTHHSGGPTEEGYSYSTTTYRLEGGMVTVEHDSTSSDCDGRLDGYHSMECPVADIAAHSYEGEQGTPLWSPVEYSQRDYAAERAGY